MIVTKLEDEIADLFKAVNFDSSTYQEIITTAQTILYNPTNLQNCYNQTNWNERTYEIAVNWYKTINNEVNNVHINNDSLEPEKTTKKIKLQHFYKQLRETQENQIEKYIEHCKIVETEILKAKTLILEKSESSCTENNVTEKTDNKENKIKNLKKQIHLINNAYCNEYKKLYAEYIIGLTNIYQPKEQIINDNDFDLQKCCFLGFYNVAMEFSKLQNLLIDEIINNENNIVNEMREIIQSF